MSRQDRLVSVDEDLICAVCHDVLDDPVLACKADHPFCRKCFLAWDKKNKTCAMCRQPTQMREDPDLRASVDKQTAYCKHCSWVGELKEAHVCTEEPVDRSMYECKYRPSGARGDIEEPAPRGLPGRDTDPYPCVRQISYPRGSLGSRTSIRLRPGRRFE